MPSLRPLACLAVLLTTAGPAFAAPVQYNLDPSHVNILWKANHLGSSDYYGKFSKTSGTVILDTDKPAESKLDVTIEIDGLVTGDEELNKHMLGGDFFRSEEFPRATFKSTKVDVTGKDTAKVTGDFTLLGITKPLTLDVKLNKVGQHPMTKQETVGFTATTKIYRSQFGMTYGVPMVSDEIDLIITAEANKAGDKPEATDAHEKSK